MNYYRNMLIILLAFAVVLSGALIVITHLNAPSPHFKSNSPNAFMTDITATKMSLQGQPKSTLYAPKLQHYLKKNQSVLQKPHIIFYKTKQQNNHWDVYASTANISQGAKTIVLKGNVKAIKAANRNTPKTTFMTSEITVYPNNQVAISDKNVKIIQNDSVVHSKGIKAYLKTGMIKLLSQAKGEFDPSDESS